MSFYTTTQNNSGGRFQGPAYTLIAEADSEGEAVDILIDMGAYRDDGMDCPCCGSRWYLNYLEGSKEPSIYGMSISEYVATGRSSLRTDDMPAVLIRYKDKTEEKHYYQGKK